MSVSADNPGLYVVRMANGHLDFAERLETSPGQADNVLSWSWAAGDDDDVAEAVAGPFSPEQVASLPDLLTACKGMVRLLREFIPPGSERSRMLHLAMAAIWKAEGAP